MPEKDISKNFLKTVSENCGSLSSYVYDTLVDAFGNDYSNTVKNFLSKSDSKSIVAFAISLGTSNNKKLLSDNFLNFASSLDSQTEFALFKAIQSSNEVDRLSSQKVIDFKNAAGNKALCGMYETIVSLNYVPENLESMLSKNVAATLKYADKNASRTFFELVFREDNAEKFTSENIQKIIGMLGPDAYYLFQALSKPGTLEVLTSDDGVRFSMLLGKTAAYFYKAISNSIYPESILNTKVISKDIADFALALGEYSQDYFKAIGECKDPSALLDKRFTTRENADKIKAVSYGGAGHFFKALAMYKDDIFENGVLDAALSMGEYAHALLKLIEDTGEVKKLTDKRLLEFAKKMNYAKENIFYIALNLDQKTMHEVLRTMDGIDISRKNEWIYHVGQYIKLYKDPTAAQYFSRTAKALKDNKEKVPFVSFANFDKIAPYFFQALSIADDFEFLERHILASESTLIHNSNLSNIYSGSLDDARKYMDAKIHEALEKYSIDEKALKPFTNAEKLKLLEGLLSNDSMLPPHNNVNAIKDMITSINKIAEKDATVFDGIILGIKRLTPTASNAKGLDIISIVDALVKGLNGSRDEEAQVSAFSKLAEICGGTDKAIEEARNAKAAWSKVKYKRMPELLNAYRSFLANPTPETAKNVFGVFDAEKNSQISKVVNAARNASLDYETGKYLVAYMGRSPFMLFDNRELSCCAFFPFGENRNASLQYLIDDNILLIGFSDANKMPKEPSWQFVKNDLRNMNAVAIASIAYLNNEKILYIDSFESSLENWNKLYSKNVDFVYHALVKAARNVGAGALLFNLHPNNATPNKLIDEMEKQSLKSMIRKEEINFASSDTAFLEGRQFLSEGGMALHYLLPIDFHRRS
ncbi:MAG: hypothetical protein QXS03_01380 [Candidatus Micrarchaeaceae archaeon]